MGQSVTLDSAGCHPRSLNQRLSGSMIQTPCGWIGFTGINDTVHQLRLGYADPLILREELRFDDAINEIDWHPELSRDLLAYACGEEVSFVGIRCNLPSRTEFQQRVIQFVREIPYGSVVSYGEVAHAVGYPRAARAVGTVMSSNPLPLIIPCHRVVAAGGRLGNYTSPRGTEMKRWLLELEGAVLPLKHN